MKKILFLLLLSRLALAQSCPDLAKALSKIDTNYTHEPNEPKRFRLKYEHCVSLLNTTFSSQRQVSTLLIELQHALNDTYNAFKNDGFQDIKYYIEKPIKIFSMITQTCQDVDFKVFEKEIKFYERGVASILATKNSSKTDYKDSLQIDYSLYGGAENAKAYMESKHFGSVSVGKSSSTPKSSASERTQYVGSHTRRTKSGKTVPVKSYYRSRRRH